MKLGRQRAVISVELQVPGAQRMNPAIVLLKNQDQLLPLEPATIATLALIGSNADKQRTGTHSGKPVRSAVGFQFTTTLTSRGCYDY
jgi:hypothetical protein